MNLAELLLLVLKSSIMVLVFSVGLGTKPRELTTLLRQPGQLLRALLSMNVVMLVVAVAIAMAFPLHHSVKVLLIALALSPTPPIIPKKLVKAGGGHDYVMALLFTASVVAIFWIPFASEVLDRVFPADIAIPPAAVLKLVGMTVLGPTLAGIVVGMLMPGVAARIAGPLAQLATLLLLVGIALILVKTGPAILAQIGDGTLLAIVIFLVVGLLVGHLLGGPTPGNRSALALATASRHPGVAIAIAQLTFPAEKSVIAAALLYLLVSVVVTLPYVSWRKKALAADGAPA